MITDLSFRCCEKSKNHHLIGRRKEQMNKNPPRMDFDTKRICLGQGTKCLHQFCMRIDTFSQSYEIVIRTL